MHMESASVDGKFPVKGSINWTSAGERCNDENTLLIRSKRLTFRFNNYYGRIWNSIPEKWSARNSRPDPESMDSGTACFDGTGNNFDNLADGNDPGFSRNPHAMQPLPPHTLVGRDNHRNITKRYRLIKSRKCHPSYPD